MLRKIIFLAVASLSVLGYVFAGETGSNSTLEAPEFGAIQEYNFEFKAVADGGKINLSWNAFPDGENFKWYKLAYSATKENPSYPEDTSHFIGEKREQTTGEFWSKEKMLYVRLCAITHDNQRFCSGSRKVILNQETIKTETPTMCTMEYAPVCGELNVPVMKGSSIPTKTFSNKCMLNAQKAKFLYEGECKKTTTPEVKACTKEYMPVCGKSKEGYKIYSNNCMRENAGALKVEIKHCEGQGEIPKTNIGSGSILPNSQLLFKKADSIIQNFLKKLEEKNYSQEKVVQILSDISVKLETLKSQEKYKVLVPYMQNKLNEAKSKYEDNFSDIEKIFGEY